MIPSGIESIFMVFFNLLMTAFFFALFDVYLHSSWTRIV